MRPFVLLGLLTSCIPLVAMAEEDPLAPLRSEVDAINERVKTGELEVEQVELGETDSPEAVEYLRIYRDAGIPVQMVHTEPAADGTETTRIFYWSGDDLLYVYRLTTPKEGGTEETERAFFKEGVLIAWTGADGEERGDEEERAAHGESLVKEAATLLEAAKRSQEEPGDRE